MRLFGQHTQAVADRIVDAFRTPECLPAAIAPLFIHRKDEVPCRKWSWHNQLVTVLSGTSDARGIQQWNRVKRKVKKGSHAIWILAPCLKKVKEMDEAEKEKQVIIGFRSVPVFAVEDTEGDDLPARDEKYARWVKELPFLAVAEVWGVKVDTYSANPHTPLGFYRYSGEDRKAILLGVENLSTWTHELVHAADHRLSHLKGAAWMKEVVAELGGAVLLECLGLHHEADLGGAYRYIESYAAQAKKEPVRACIEVLDRVCNCVKLILDEAEQASLKSQDAPALSAAV